MGQKNRSLVDEWLEDDKLILLESWARDYDLTEIADKMGIALSTLRKWRDQYEEIGRALSKGRELVDYKVENALLKSALGFTTKEIKVTLGKQVKGGQVFMITKEVTEKEIAPNVTACLAWLNNRLPDKWKRNRDKTIDIEDEDNNLQITIARGPKSEDDDNINNEIKLQKADSKTKKEKENNEKESIKKDDLDYWPDDWEEEDE